MTNRNSTISMAMVACFWVALFSDLVGQTPSKDGSSSPHSVVHSSYYQTQGFGALPNVPAPQYGDPPPPTTGLRHRSDSETSVYPAPVLPQPQAQQYTTGLPFVTPAPGRYPTSPYTGPRNSAVYQSVGYQRATSGAVPTNAGGLPLGVAGPASVPQYQTNGLQATPYQAPAFSPNPAPGIYPTGYQQCQTLPPPSLPPDGAPSLSYVPSTVTPNMAPGMYSANNAGYRPLFSLGQENYNVVLGRGIIGQPTAYVPGQCIRNFLRYISP